MWGAGVTACTNGLGPIYEKNVSGKKSHGACLTEMIINYHSKSNRKQTDNIFGKYSNSFFTSFPHVLHYAPTDGSKNGETVFSVLHQRPGETWKLPDPEDPMSVTDEVNMHPAT